MYNHKKYIEFISSFGIYIFIIASLSRLLRVIKVPKALLIIIDNYKHKIVEQRLEKEYKYIISEDISIKVYNNEEKTYVFWWQGVDHAPEIVKLCITSIKKNSPYEVIILSEDNFREYVDIPDFIIEKVKCKNISLAHFSDILRFYLLYQRGGFWIDATDFLTKPIPSNILCYNFYSIKGAYPQPGLGWDWSSWFMYAKPYNAISYEMIKFYNYYWRNYNQAVTYLILDCFLTLLVKNNKEIAKLIHKIPETGTDVFWLVSHLNDNVNSQIKDYLFNHSAFVQKVTYKMLLKEDNTLYSFLKNEKI